MKKERLGYGVACLVLLLVEILIGLFVRDRFIRPYGGDILVTVLLCCLLRFCFPRMPGIAVLVFIFAALVEVGQYFALVEILGLGENRFWRVVLGSTFSWADLVCYGVGCVMFGLVERWIGMGKNT